MCGRKERFTYVTTVNIPGELKGLDIETQPPPPRKIIIKKLPNQESTKGKKYIKVQENEEWAGIIINYILKVIDLLLIVQAS